MEQQTVRKTYKYKLNPTAQQERELARVLRLCRALYNTALEQRVTAWQRSRVSPLTFPARGGVEGYSRRPSRVRGYPLARVARCAGAAGEDLSGVLSPPASRRESGLPALPRPRRATTPSPTKSLAMGPRLDNGFLVLAKIGRIAVRWSRPLEGTPKTVTICKEADGWYACISCADVPVQPLPTTGRETGIDLGIEAFATLSGGTRIFSPGWYRQAERALKTAQRRVSRRKKGSNRRRKAITLLAKAHQKVRRQRQDVHHKTALALVRDNDVIYHEDLQTANMLKNHHLAKSISDASWAAFLSILSDKAACAGRSVVAVPPAFTSQRCSGCGRMVCERLIGPLAPLPV